MDAIRVALLGLSDTGLGYLEGLRADPRYELVAVADSDLRRLRALADQPAVRAFEDCRSLIVECAHHGLDALFVALEPFESLPFVQMAAEREIGVFHEAPAARNVRELTDLVQRFARSGRPFVIARAQPAAYASRAVERAGAEIGEVYAVSADAQIAVPSSGWRADSARAGGGILLNGAYGMVDALVGLFGRPETVYALCGAHPRSASARSDTEDGAVVTLRFAKGQIGSLMVYRVESGPDWSISLVGTTGTLLITQGAATVIGNDGLSRLAIELPAEKRTDIQAFADAWMSPEITFPSTGTQHLPTMAVIESAYLSAKTGAAELPAKLLRA